MKMKSWDDPGDVFTGCVEEGTSARPRPPAQTNNKRPPKKPRHSLPRGRTMSTKAVGWAHSGRYGFQPVQSGVGGAGTTPMGMRPDT